MSLTKRGYGEQLRKILYPNTTPDAKLTLQQAMLAFCQARDEYVSLKILRNKAETHIVPSTWLSTFEGLAIKQDDKQRYYTDLPVKVISDPRDLGVYQAWRDGLEDQFLIPVTPGFLAMNRFTPARELEGEHGYYMRGKRMYYIQEMDIDTTISVRLIAQSADLGDLDYFPIDDSCVPEILQRAVEMYGIQKQIPADVSNDGISD